ncbi:UNVERIFIED_CONTAM: hypothetical protein FKN15_023439 [Acipenser sinensis]
MSAAISSLEVYCSGSGSDSDGESRTSTDNASQDATAHLRPLGSEKTLSLQVLNSAPVVAVKQDVETGVHLDPSLKEVMYNPTCDTMFAPEFGLMNPFKTQQMSAPRNMLSGYAEPAHLNDFMFEEQRRAFSTFGKLYLALVQTHCKQVAI